MQSLPFSYLALSAVANDGGSHTVEVYTDISAEWASGDPTQTVSWSTNGIGSSIVTHQVQLENQQTYTEFNDHIQRKLSNLSHLHEPLD